MSEKDGAAGGGDGRKRRESDPSDTTTPSPETQSPESRPLRRKRRSKRLRLSSTSSDGTIIDVQQAMRSMDRLLLHTGKLHVFRMYFRDPTMEFATRFERRRHAAGRDRRPLDDKRAVAAVLGIQAAGLVRAGVAAGFASGVAGSGVDPTNAVDNANIVQADNLSDRSSSPSSRGLSSGSSFPSFASLPDPNPEFNAKPFEGLGTPPKDGVAGPSTAAEPAKCAAKPSKARDEGSLSSAEGDQYMASRSATDSDDETLQPAPQLNANQVAETLQHLQLEEGQPRYPSPEPMSESSDPSPPESAAEP